MTDFEKIVEVIKEKKSFILITHLNPDGDGLGSELALAPVLKGMGKEVLIANTNGLPGLYKFLPKSEIVKSEVSQDAHFDAAIIFECPSIERIGNVVDLKKQVDVVLNIDHHADNKRYGHVNWVDSSAAAVGEQIYTLILALGGKVDKDIATCLFTSIYTDTGGFRYSNTDEAVMRTAAELLKSGVEPHFVTNALLEQNSLAKIRLLGFALDTLKISENEKVACIEVSLEMIRKTGAQDFETEGFVDYPRSLAKTEVAVFFKEAEGKKVKASFRSKGRVDVSRIAAVFGGGGHSAASGCTVAGSLEEVKILILAEVKNNL